MVPPLIVLLLNNWGQHFETRGWIVRELVSAGDRARWQHLSHRMAIQGGAQKDMSLQSGNVILRFPLGGKVESDRQGGVQHAKHFALKLLTHVRPFSSLRSGPFFHTPFSPSVSLAVFMHIHWAPVAGPRVLRAVLGPTPLIKAIQAFCLGASINLVKSSLLLTLSLERGQLSLILTLSLELGCHFQRFTSSMWVWKHLFRPEHTSESYILLLSTCSQMVTSLGSGLSSFTCRI